MVLPIFGDGCCSLIPVGIFTPLSIYFLLNNSLLLPKRMLRNLLKNFSSLDFWNCIMFTIMYIIIVCDHNVEHYNNENPK